jgi:hypothetical protein
MHDLHDLRTLHPYMRVCMLRPRSNRDQGELHITKIKQEVIYEPE